MLAKLSWRYTSIDQQRPVHSTYSVRIVTHLTHTSYCYAHPPHYMHVMCIIYYYVHTCTLCEYMIYMNNIRDNKQGNTTQHNTMYMYVSTSCILLCVLVYLQVLTVLQLCLIFSLLALQLLCLCLNEHLKFQKQ